MRRRWLLASVGVIIGGCASTQLNYNTLDLASTVDNLLTVQIVNNLSNFIGSPTAVPSQVVINGGNASTTNTMSSSFFDPLTKALTLVGSFGATGAVTSSSRTSVNAANTLTLSGSNVAAQNWAFDPVNDGDQLRRLHALYRFAVEGNGDETAQRKLLEDYPLHYASDQAKKNGEKNGAEKKKKKKKEKKPGDDPEGGQATPGDMLARRLDRIALNAVNCVVCECQGNEHASGQLLTRMEAKVCLQLNKRLLPPPGVAGNWLRWSNGTEADACWPRRDASCVPRPVDIPIGRSRTRELYVSFEQWDRYAEFAIFIAVASESSPSTSAAGGAARKGKGSLSTPTNNILLVQ